MADYPGFIAIETGDEDGLPLVIAWSLPDGRIKQTLIQPDDSWINEDTNVMGAYSIEELESLGVSPLDVIRELETDHFSATLYTSDNGDDEAALARLFDTYGIDPFVELAPAKVLYESISSSEWHRLRSETFNDLGLEPMRPEDEIAVMLSLHQRLTEPD
ncbi:MAG: hypothetical protein JJT87_00045 [Halomonas sp.]|uniref:hypothetical protein n=1 Tax=unclassified Halomonas TaxID=2609666 RepID=UPI00099051FD|nr:MULTISPECIES: hypothetical protein [unclassified Halomonas]AQU82913.1 hypothetical protein B2G49_10025 [Halomonas sp. 'Soap Lake \